MKPRPVRSCFVCTKQSFDVSFRCFRLHGAAVCVLFGVKLVGPSQEVFGLKYCTLEAFSAFGNKVSLTVSRVP